MNAWLLDTGPIVALLDPGDPAHAQSKTALIGYKGEFVTTSAVVIEAMHFLRKAPNGPTRLVNFIEDSDARIYDCCQRPSLRKAAFLMSKYRTTPMDFADATLILLGAAIGTKEICTTDRRGFTVFRTLTGKRFDLVLD